MTKTAIFENSRWRTAAILKIALTPYISRELSDFDQICEADAHFNSHDGHLTKNLNFENSRWRMDAILKIVFGYISASYWLINTTLMRNLDRIYRITCQYRSHDQNCNFRKLKMADGRHFLNSFIAVGLYQPWNIRFRSNLVHWCKFPFRACKFDKKIKIVQIQDGGRTPYWKSFFGYISASYWPINAKYGTKWRITRSEERRVGKV